MTRFYFEQFPPGATIALSAGYDTIIITDQHADIDPADAGALALAKKHGGVETKPSRRTRQKQED